MTGQPLCECRFCGRDDLSPQGHGSHETHCDENPNPGVPYDQQKDLGLLESQEGADTDPRPNPDQSDSAEGSAGLPPVERLAAVNSSSEDVATDGGERVCPLCGSEGVMDADDAKAEYIDRTDRPNPKAVLGYELADHACQEPACAALWGEKYEEPLPMKAVVNA